MTTLNVVGVENGTLVLVSSDGDRFFVPITDQLTQALRPKPATSSGDHKASPKDIQAHIRRGLSAEEVAALTGEELVYIQKFEGAVVAEREFIVSQAHEVLVQSPDGGEEAFVASVRTRLDHGGGQEVSWSAWKEESGWRVELVFREGGSEHRAQWEFDPRKHLLTPLNDEAAALGKHEPVNTTLIPKLQVVTPDGEPDRFDSEIFEASDLGETGPMLEPVPYGRQGDQGDAPMADTADLLEALRKKRGEREGSPEYPPSRSAHPATGGIHIVDEDHDAEVTPITGPIREDSDDPDDDPEPPSGSRKDRAPMPSWDDIVFGARSDDDPA